MWARAVGRTEARRDDGDGSYGTAASTMGQKQLT